MGAVRGMEMRTRSLVAIAAAAVLATLVLVSPAQAIMTPQLCQTDGTWKQGEMNVYWLDVNQGDGQLIVGPTGKTMLIDTGVDVITDADQAGVVASALRSICGLTADETLILDYAMASHNHRDHAGQPGRPGIVDGSGLYRLLTPASEGGYDFQVRQLVVRENGSWNLSRDANLNGLCESGEIDWINVGEISMNDEWVCWVDGLDTQADRVNIAGRVFKVADVLFETSSPLLSLDLGGGAAAQIINANGFRQGGAVNGDHRSTALNENEYSIALEIQYGGFQYATAGDTGGDSTYFNSESYIDNIFGNVDVMRVNHHGSGNSSNSVYLDHLNPEVSVASCGYLTDPALGPNHPHAETLARLRAIDFEKATTQSTDIYLTNVPCYTGSVNDYGDAQTGPSPVLNNYSGRKHIWLHTENAGNRYVMTYDVRSALARANYTSGQRCYTSNATTATGKSRLQINEARISPADQEFVEIYNPTSASVPVTGLYIDDLKDTDQAPRAVTGGDIPAGGRRIVNIGTGSYYNNEGDQVRLIERDGSGSEIAMYDCYSYELNAAIGDARIFHRMSDGGLWCSILSTFESKGTANRFTCP